MGSYYLPEEAKLKKPCPRCNSPQSFKSRRREEEDKVQVYIACTMCRWEIILYEGTEEQVELKKDIEELRGKAMRGDPIQPVLKKRQERLRDS